MVTTKRCVYGTCRNDSRYPSLGKESQMMIQLSFSISLAQLDNMRDGKGGLLHVIAVIRSFVRRIVTFTEYTLLVEMVQQKSILIQYQPLPVKKR